MTVDQRTAGSESPRAGWWRLVKSGADHLRRHPWLLVGMIATHLAATAAATAGFEVWVGPILRHRPEPDLLGWSALAVVHHGATMRAALTAGVVLVLYSAVGTAWTGVVVARLGGRPWHSAGKTLARMVLFRVLVLVFVAGSVAAWWQAATWLAPWSLTFADDRAPVLVQVALAAVTLAPVVTLLLVDKVGLVLVAENGRILDGLTAAVGAVRRRPGTLLGLWLGAWAMWLAVTLVTGSSAARSLWLSWTVSAVRTAVHLWLVCAVWELLTRQRRLNPT